MRRSHHSVADACAVNAAKTAVVVTSFFIGSSFAETCSAPLLNCIGPVRCHGWLDGCTLR
jgi:hypothetical protein